MGLAVDEANTDSTNSRILVSATHTNHLIIKILHNDTETARPELRPSDGGNSFRFMSWLKAGTRFLENGNLLKKCLQRHQFQNIPIVI